MTTIEDMSYWRDPRVIAAMTNDAYRVVSANQSETTVRLFEECLERLIEYEHLPEGHDGTFKGQTKFEVCDTCSGSGKTVNPSIDAGGLSQEDFDEDPDFAESYFSGNYDIVCAGCKGEKVVPHIIFHDHRIGEAVREWQVDAAEEAASSAHERMMGY